MTQIDASELSGKLGFYQRKCMLLDVREKEEYMRGHIPGSVNIPLSELAERMKEIKKDKEIVAICLSGGRASVAAKMLEREGCKVKVMEGGMKKWTGPVEK